MADMLSQDEIEELLNGSLSSEDDSDQQDYATLSEHEIDALNELSNIAMMDSAKVLFKLVGKQSSFSSPQIELVRWEDLKQNIEKTYEANKCMGVSVEFTQGIAGANLFAFALRDTAIIADLMMSGEGQNVSEDLSDLQISAIGEAMNQMISAFVTSMSSVLSKTISINSPKTAVLQLDSFNTNNFFSQKENLVKISFKIVVEGLIDGTVLQIMPISFAKLIVENLINTDDYVKDGSKDLEEPELSPDTNSDSVTMLGSENVNNGREVQQPDIDIESDDVQVQTSQYSGHPRSAKPAEQKKMQVNVQPAQFQTFEDVNVSVEKENMELIRDIPLSVTVELGRTQKLIRNILEFGQGTIIELDKLAGEPVDILVNGKFIAKGEVVVIDENFGVRITDIVHPSKRI